ncbi:hypothetical protein SAMN02745216_03103 [Desulfatibacillum alkenivorans DSM 16219]|uniref:Uncharacterized protein n=1 Tax=Desulfatibacillum alkenivorans DSM 16219 TaxID=1121393 RepID=A0A1M6QQD3_9BACT|nr:hypothetical protein SAMN02745216_03103 [Desulfatibacillum alkenivorans DSM 16219]
MSWARILICSLLAALAAFYTGCVSADQFGSLHNDLEVRNAPDGTQGGGGPAILLRRS